MRMKVCIGGNTGKKGLTMGRMCANRKNHKAYTNERNDVSGWQSAKVYNIDRNSQYIPESICEANIFSRGGQALRFRCVVVMTDEKYEAVRRENAWDDEACGDRIARVDVIDDVCGMVIHFV